MKELKDLTETEKAVLLVCCNANNFSLGSHIPIEAIKKGVKKEIRSKYVKISIKKLVSNGFIIKHPTRGKITYQLSRKGLKSGYKLKKIYSNI